MRTMKLTTLIQLGLASLLATSAVTAEDGAIRRDALKIDGEENAGLEISRDVSELQAMLKAPPDVDVVDTALVFNNPRRHKTLIACVGYNQNGRVLGRAYTVVPVNGIRFIRASDLSNGRDFLGSAQCKARARVIPSAFIVGAGFSDSPAQIVHGWDDSTIRFPIVASY